MATFPWYGYDDALVPAMAFLVGAEPAEVSLMGTLTANLHHLFASFFAPSGRRTKILIESTAFPSDRYAVTAQLRWHGLDPREHLVEVEPDGAGLYGSRPRAARCSRRGATRSLSCGWAASTT